MKNKSNTSLSLRKFLLSALVAAPLATLPAPLWALPSTDAANLTKPSTTTVTPIGGTTLQITDTTQNRLVLKWNEFGSGGSPISNGDTIIWTLPSSSSAVLNMVTTGSTTVNGALQSNGSIFIVNSNGIIFGNTARVTAAGLGLSTVPQNEFFFVASGALDTTSLASATGDISIDVSPAASLPTTATTYPIDVGTTGNIVLSGRAVDVSGTIRAGLLTVNTNSGTTGARLGQTARNFEIGVAGTAATGTTAAVPGTGNVTINTNGGAAVLSGANATTIRGGVLTVNTANGAVSQGAGAVALGDGLSDPSLTITAGTGTVNLQTLDVDGSNANRLDVTIPSAGNTSIRVADAMRLRPSNITGTLSLRSNDRNVDSGGASTVTGAVTLQAANGRDITFNNTLDTTFGTISSGGSADSDVTLVSGGSIVLPGISVGGNLTVTAATNITQQAATSLLVGGSDKRAQFNSTGGSITLTNATNDITRTVLINAPGGVTMTDVDDLAIIDGTNVTGNATITASSIALGADAGDEITFNSNLTLNATGGVGGVSRLTLTSGGTGYTAAPGVTITDGGATTGTARLTVTAIPVTAGGTGFTTAPTVTVTEGASVATATSTINLNAVASFTGGAGYTAAPTVTVTGGGGTITVAPTATLGLATVPTFAGGTGYTAGDLINVSGGGSTANAVLTVTTVGGAGEVTGFTIAPGAGFTSLAPAGLAEAGGTGTGFNILTATGVVNAITAPTGTGFTAQPTVSLAGSGATTVATAVLSGPLASVNVPATGGTNTGFTLGAADVVAASAAGQTVQPTFGEASGTVSTLTLDAAGVGFTGAPTVAFTAAGGAGAAATAAIAITGGGVSDGSNNVTVFGLTQINSLGAVRLDGATSSGIGLNHRFGQVNVSQGASTSGVTLYESTTLNLGAITSGGKLRAYSSAGDVIDTGPIVVGTGLLATDNGAEFGAGTAAAPGNITIDSAGTSIGGRIAILDDVALLTNAAANGGAVIGTYLANNVTISTAGSITLAPISSTAETGIAGALNLTATAAGSDITLAGATRVGSGVTLNANDAITGTSTSSRLGTANVTAGGIVDLRSGGTFIVNATLSENAAGNTALFRSGAALQIGSINSNYTGLVTFQAAGGNDVTDNVNAMRVFGPVHFQSARHIIINNTGHSFGRVSANTSANNGRIEVVESGGLRIGSIGTHGTGSVTLTSTTGDILQDVTQAGIVLGNGVTGTATFNAASGSITLNDNDTTGGVNSMSIINATAAGNIVINNPRLTTLGNITSGTGTLSVDSANTHTAGVAVAAADNNIVQTSSGRVNVFGTVTLTANGAGAITLGNTGNRMGGITATTGSGAITLNENPTMNLLSVRTSGTVTATSETGSIIDSLATFTANTANTTATPANSLGTATVPISGTFSAPNGNITLDLAGNNIGTLGFTTGGNVSIVDSTGATTLGASTIGGTLDVFNMVATTGVITQSGSLNITGDVTLTTNGGTVSLGDTTNMLGGIRFSVGNGGALIAENTTLNLRGGSSSSGPVQLVTNGNFITSGPGASTIVGPLASLTIQAQGTIIPGPGSLVVNGTFTVFSPALKDLSGLSKSGNLFGRDPINLGAGTYVPPTEP